MATVYDIWFHKIKLSNYSKKRMLSHVKSCKAIYEATYETCIAWGLSDYGIRFMQEQKKDLEVYETILNISHTLGIEVIGYFDEEYPYLLRFIEDPPIVLYVLGEKTILNKEIVVGIVGARKCTEYGYYTASRLGKELAEYGGVVVSGMALGIDAAAHYGALLVGRSIAVLGCGVEYCYPKQNASIYRALINKGCIISEYEPYTSPKPYHFPRRNRIISGMAQGIVVVEAAKRSGSLITAQLALDYNREVYTVKGRERSKLSIGTNELIESGAKVVSSGAEIIQELPINLNLKQQLIKKNEDKIHNQLALEESIVYAYVSQEPIFLLNLRQLLVSTELSCENIDIILLQLEIKGLIRRLPGERYVRI